MLVPDSALLFMEPINRSIWRASKLVAHAGGQPQEDPELGQPQEPGQVPAEELEPLGERDLAEEQMPGGLAAPERHVEREAVAAAAVVVLVVAPALAVVVLVVAAVAPALLVVPGLAAEPALVAPALVVLVAAALVAAALVAAVLVAAALAAAASGFDAAQAVVAAPA